MKRRQLTSQSATLLPVVFLALVLGTSHYLDLGPDDHSAEQAQAKALEDLQQAEARLERAMDAAALMCQQEFGLNSAPVLLDDGAMACTHRRGVMPLAQASKERAAMALCMQEHGPGVAIAWTDTGDLVCKPRRGRAA